MAILLYGTYLSIFTYGPNYELTETNYYQIRLVPKNFHLRSKMFKYHSCTFKFEEHKLYNPRLFPQFYWYFMVQS